MPSIELKNFNILKLKDKNQNPYYLIKDNETEKVYICFQKALKEGWEGLERNYQTLNQLEIEFEEKERGNQVVSLWGNLEEFFV